MRAPSYHAVPVEGGSLHVARWEGVAGAPVVIAIAGVTATHMAWCRVAGELGEAVTLIAADLRGRGGSNTITGPFGHRAHAADVIATLDAFGVDRATIVGHSMGGFIAPYTAKTYPSRIEAVVVMDGGMRLLEPPPGADVETLLQQVIGPSLDRLRTTFPSRDAYADFWRAHPGLSAEGWNDYIQAYINYDLVPAGDGSLRSGVSLDAVLRDSADTLFDDEICTSIFRVTQPMTFLRAARGVMNDAPLYAESALEPLRRAVAHAQIETIDTNHFLLSLGKASATVADRIRKAAGA